MAVRSKACRACDGSAWNVMIMTSVSTVTWQTNTIWVTSSCALTAQPRWGRLHSMQFVYQCPQKLWRSCRPAGPASQLHVSTVGTNIILTNYCQSSRTCKCFICQSTPSIASLGPRTWKFRGDWFININCTFASQGLLCVGAEPMRDNINVVTSSLIVWAHKQNDPVIIPTSTKWVIAGAADVLLPVWHQALTWTNMNPWTNFCETQIKNYM